MIELRKLSHWRRADLEAVIWKDGRPEGNIAGDIVLGPASSARSIRFSIEQHDGAPRVTLSAENHTLPTDVDVGRFLKFAGLKAVREIPAQVHQWCRHIEVAPR